MSLRRRWRRFEGGGARGRGGMKAVDVDGLWKWCGQLWSLEQDEKTMVEEIWATSTVTAVLQHETGR